MNIRVNNIDVVGYFDFSEIKKAVDENQFEERSFQRDLGSILHERNSLKEEDREAFDRRYHYGRIAALSIKDSWKKEPIIVYNNKKNIFDDGHRVWAAKHVKSEEIDAIVLNTDIIFTDEMKNKVWAKVTEYGNFIDALNSLDIDYCY